MERNEGDSVLKYDDDLMEIDLKEYLFILWRKKYFLTVLVFTAIIISFLITRQITPVYETSTLIMVKEGEGINSFLDNELSFLAGMSRDTKSDTYIAIMKSRNILEDVIKSLDLRDEEGEPLRVESLRQMISITKADSSNLINIRVNYTDKVLASDIANKLVDVFKEQNKQMNRSDLQNASEFINSQLKTVHIDLNWYEEELLEYKQEHGVIIPDEFARTLINRLTALESKKEETEITLEESRMALAKIEEEFSRQERELITSRTIAANPVVTENQSRLVGLQIEKAGLLEKYTENHPKVIEVHKKIEEIKGVLTGAVAEVISSQSETINPLYQQLKGDIIELQTAIIAGNAVVEGLNLRIGEIEKELVNLPEVELDLLRLQRENQVAENLYLLLKTRKAEVDIQQSMLSSDIIIIDPAVVRGSPVKPRLKMNMVIAAFLAFITGVFVIFLQEYLDNTVKEEKDIKNLTGLPVLGLIPDFDSVDFKGNHGSFNNKGENFDL